MRSRRATRSAGSSAGAGPSGRTTGSGSHGPLYPARSSQSPAWTSRRTRAERSTSRQMTDSVVVVAGGLVGLGAAGVGAGAAAVAARRDRPYLPGSHAEPAPQRRDPVAAALHHGYSSIGLAVGLDHDGTLRLATAGDE